jgi:hypothetical protein
VKTTDDIEAYLLRMQAPFEEIKEGMYLVHAAPGGSENLVISIGGPVVVFRMKVMEVPKQAREQLYRMLLELNANEMLHAAYGVEGANIVISDALELENLDYNEFQATVDDILLAVAKHYPKLAAFRAAA